MTRTKRLASVALMLGIGWLANPATAQAECAPGMQCPGGPTRIMLILDASSAMLNGGNAAAPEGMSDWDLFRRVVADPGSSVYDAQIDPGIVASQVAHFGLIVFGDAAPAPGEQKRVVDYGPCTRQNVQWALDPRTSCDAPDCTNPWSGPPIAWTFKDGSAIDPPGFALETLSHMPRCDAGQGTGCTGSGRAVHLGLQLARQNRMSYPDRTPFTQSADTQYVNILLVAGSYADASTDAEVQTGLETAFQEGVTTYVVGFGAGAQTPTTAFTTELDNMAAWGSNGAIGASRAVNEAELDQALADIVGGLSHPCCQTIDCSSAGGADDGGADGGTGNGGGAATWGSADGGGSASASEGDSASATASATAGSDEIDDDGGCTCGPSRRTLPATWFGLFAALLVTRRRRI